MTIENLELEVKQSGIEQSARSIAKLKNAIAGLQSCLNGDLNFGPIKDAVSSLSGIGKIDAGPGLSKLATGLENLKKAINGVDYGKLQTLAQALNAISKVGKISSIPKGFAEGIKNIADAIKEINNSDIAKIEKLGDALSKFPSSIGNIPKNLAERIAEIGNAAIQLDSAAIKKLSELGDALQKFKGLSGIGISSKDARSIANAANAANNANNAGRSGNAGSSAGRGISDSANSSKGGSFWSSIGNGIASAAKKEIPFLGELSGVLSNVSSAAAGAAGALGYLATKFAVSVLKDFISNCKKVASGLKDIGVAAAKYLWNSTPFARFTNAIKGTIKQVSQFVNSIGRIAFYRLIRSAIKALTDGFKDGLDALYNYDAALGGSFSKNMDAIYQKSNQLKASFATLAANFINIFAPAVEAVMNIIIKLSDGISSLVAALGGGVFYKAALGTGKYADSLSEATKAANEYKNQILGFDEINKLSDSESSSSSASGINFEPYDLEGWLKGLKKLIEDKEFYKAGKLIATQLNDMVANFDAKSWGQKLGKKIQSGIELALGFMEKFDFTTLGQKVADAIGSFITSIKAVDLGKLLAEKWNSVFQSITGFFDTLKTYDLGAWIGNLFNSWFSNISTDDAVSAITSAVGFVLDSIGDFVDTFDLSAAVTKVTDLLYQAFTSAADIINGSDLPQKLADWINKVDWDDAAQKLSNAAVALLDALVNLWDELDVPAIADKILTALSKIDWASIMGDIAHIAAEWFTIKLNAKIAIAGGKIGSVWDAFWGSLAKTAGNELWTEEDEAKTTASNIESTYDTTFSSITEEASTAAAEATNIATSGAGDFSTAYNDALANLGTDVGNFQYDTFSATKDALNNVEANSEEISSVSTETANAIREEIANAVSESSEKFSQGLTDMITAIESFRDDTGTAFDELSEKISTSMDGIQTIISDGLDATGDAANEKISELFTDFSNGFVDISDAANSSMNDVENGVSRAMNNCISAVQNAVRQMKSALNFSTTVSSSSSRTGGSVRISTRASGGFVKTGQLFAARESGPELVGKIGGSTAVANNEQIISGIRQGVYEAVSSVMNNKKNDTSVNVYLDGLAMARRIYPYTKQVQNEHGTSLING